MFHLFNGQHSFHQPTDNMLGLMNHSVGKGAWQWDLEYLDLRPTAGFLPLLEKACGKRGKLQCWSHNYSSAGVTPEMNLKDPSSTGDEAYKHWDPPWLWNPKQGISGHNWNNVLYFFKTLIMWLTQLGGGREKLCPHVFRSPALVS